MTTAAALATITPVTLVALPVEVQGMPYTQANWKALDRWLAAELGPGKYQFSDDGSHLTIETPEGDPDCVADKYWIIQGTLGEFYPIRNEVADRKYRIQAAA